MQRPPGLFLKGNFEFTRQNYRKAIKLLSSCPALQTDPQLPVLYYNNLGLVHFQVCVCVCVWMDGWTDGRGAGCWGCYGIIPSFPTSAVHWLPRFLSVVALASASSGVAHCHARIHIAA